MTFDMDILEEFYTDIYSPELQGEGKSFLLALAARDKYQMPDEGYVMCNRTEMLAREYIGSDNFTVFTSKLHRLVGNDLAYLDKNYRPIPEHLKVLYVSVNPVDLVSAYCLFMKKLAERNEELIQRKDRPVSSYTINNLWVSSMQTCPTLRRWFDFDLDLNPDSGMTPNELGDLVYDSMTRAFPYEPIRVIITHGGVHMLASNRNMSKECNPQTILQHLISEFKDRCKEVTLNKNGLIPCPGTLQGGVMVKYKSYNPKESEDEQK